jgi:hypothetical protein
VAERKPTPGLLSEFYRQLFEARPTVVEQAAKQVGEKFAEQQREMFHELLWGTEAPRQPPTAIEEQTERALPPAQPRPRKRGRRREWSSDERYQRKMEVTIDELVAEGQSDREIADAVFGDPGLYKRVQRWRLRKPGS